MHLKPAAAVTAALTGAAALATGAVLMLPAGAAEPAAVPAAAAATGTGTAPAVAPALPRALSHRFGVLRRPRTAADDLGGRTNGIPQSDYHAEHLRRVVPAAPSGAGAAPMASDAFIAPGPGGRICLLVIPPGFQGPGGTCVPRRDALAGGLTSAVDAGGGLAEVAGVVPDGVSRVTLTAEGGRSILPVVQNAYGALVHGRPLEVRYREAGGRLRRVPFGG